MGADTILALGMAKADAARNYARVNSGSIASQAFLSKLRQGLSAKLLVLGDSTGVTTGRWVYVTAVNLAAEYPALTVNYYAWNTTTSSYDAAIVVSTGSGSGVLSVYNCSISGGSTSTHYTNFNTQVRAIQPDLVAISHGHNEAHASTGATDDYFVRYAVFADEVLSACPMAAVIVIAQNPETGNTYQTDRADALSRLAALRGFGFVDFYRAFVDTGDVASYLLDGVHPNPAGTALMVAEFAKALVYAPGTPPRPQHRPTILTPGEALFANTDFAAFSGSVPTGWTAENVTASKDLTNLEGPNGYSVRLQTTTPGGGAASIYADCPYLGMVKGQWVTVAARCWLPATLPASAIYGRLNVQTSSVSDARSYTSSGDADGRGAWRWVVCKSIYVPTDCTRLRLRFYAETGGTAGDGDVRVDRIVVTRGVLPAGAIGTGGPPGVTGPTGPVSVAVAHPLRVGSYHPTARGLTTTLALVANRLMYVPWDLEVGCTIDRLRVYATVAGATNSVIRIGLYADDGAGRPGALVADYGTAVATAIGFVEVVADAVLIANRYHIGVVGQGAPATQPTLYNIGNTGNQVDPYVPVFALLWAVGCYQSTVTGARPATAAPTADAQQVPVVQVRRAA